MGKKVEHQILVAIDDENICEGSLEIQHGTIRVGKTTLATNLKWTCDVTGVDIHDLLNEAARNISVRMAAIRDLPEAAEKVAQLKDATVRYKDISSWTTKGSKGRRKISEMSVEEIAGKMTPEQIAEFIRKHSQA
jgi:hypothetical protein